MTNISLNAYELSARTKIKQHPDAPPPLPYKEIKMTWAKQHLSLKLLPSLPKNATMPPLPPLIIIKPHVIFYFLYLAFSSSDKARQRAPNSLPTSPNVKSGLSSLSLGRISLAKSMYPERGFLALGEPLALVACCVVV